MIYPGCLCYKAPKNDTILYMASFDEEYGHLNAAQKHAVNTIEGPVLVIAGPGTGKTQLLSMRVANILKLTDANPGNILCLTYTESGQQAMRQRLTLLLGRPAKKVEIHTFHGFGNYLISRFSEHFPELAGFRPADDLALYEIMRACLEKLPRSNPLSKSAYGQFTFQTDAASRISQLKQAGITPQQAAETAARDAAWCHKYGQKIAKAFNKIGRLSPKVLPLLETELAGLTAPAAAEPSLAFRCLQSLKEALNEAHTSGKTSSVSNFKKHWLTSDDGSLYFRPADQMKKIVALAELYSFYEAELQRRKLYDYDDMILYALKKLEHNAELLAEVQETFQYILADEYQDTNAAQAKIITLVASNRVNENRPNVMVVGDDDQAIYGFQGALGDVLLYFREQWREVTTITLKDNYRSTQTILDAARNLIQTATNRLENHYEDIDKTLAANVAYPAHEPVIYSAGSIEAVIDKAVQIASSADKGRQLAIIASKHKYLQQLADRLDTARVDYFYEGREDLLKDEGVVKVLMLADVALAIKQREFSRTSYVLPELVTKDSLDLTKEQVWTIAVTARQHHVSWWEVIDRTTGMEPTATLLQNFAKVIDDSDAQASLTVIARQRGVHRQRLLKSLVNHAKTYLGREQVSLPDVLYYAHLCAQAGISLSERIEKGSPNANVLLLSAHKSKGLEFDRVYVLHADYYTWFKERGRTNIISLPPGWDAIEPVKQSNDDRLRLLYVVMTRARRELAFIKSQTLQARRADQNLPGLDNLRVMEHAVERFQAQLQTPEPSWQSWYLPHTPIEQRELQRILEPILSNYHLSPSHLTTFLDVVHGGPERLLVHTLLGIPEPVHPEALFGNRVHQVLSYAQEKLNTTSQLPGDQVLRKFIKKSAPFLKKDHITDIVEVVQQFLAHTDILQPGGVSEYSFLKQNLIQNGIRLTGTVDHYIKKDDTLTITDFKTGRAINSWRVTEDYYRQKLHRFRQQLLFYNLLFQLSHDFKAVNTTQLQVAFVEPSRRGVYYNLSLDLSPDEQNQLTALMQVVWQHIMELSFPDTKTYGQDFKGVQAFETDLLAGVI